MAAIDRGKLFAGVRPIFGGSMAQSQVDGVNNIVDEWERRKLKDLRWLAYMLATTKWETDHTMQPIREKGGEAYLRSKKYYPWVGEGLVQVTWEDNHRKFGATAPGQLLTWPIALKALFDGMLNGMFTGKKLSDYFNSTASDWVNARRIVNGTDRANEIAAIAKQFYAAIVEAADGQPYTPPPAKPKATVPAPKTTTAGTVAAGAAAKAAGFGWPETLGIALAAGVVILIAAILVDYLRRKE